MEELGLITYTIQGSTPKDTIEERILDLQDKKAELLDVLSNEGGSILEMSKDELLALLD